MSGGVIFGLCFIWFGLGFCAFARYRGLIVETLKDPEHRGREYPQGYDENEKLHWIILIAGLISFMPIMILCGGGYTTIYISKALKAF